MTTLIEFLLARIAETERANALIADWRGAFDKPAVTVCLPNGSQLWTADMLRLDCEAKRRIVGQYKAAVVAAAEETDTEVGWIKDGVEKALSTTLRALALPYADHEDYREEWKP